MAAAASNEFVAMVCESLAPLGDVRARRMFGGYGIFCDGVPFALIAFDTLFFRTDEINRPAYESRGLQPFRPFADRPEPRSMVMPYHTPPDSVFDDPEEMLAWARPAFEAALRARAKKPPARAGRRRLSGADA